MSKNNNLYKQTRHSKHTITERGDKQNFSPGGPEEGRRQATITNTITTITTTIITITIITTTITSIATTITTITTTITGLRSRRARRRRRPPHKNNGDVINAYYGNILVIL